MLVSLASSIFSTISKIMDQIKTEQLKQQGKTEQAAEILAKENEILRKQQEILAQNQTKEQTIDKLNDGKF